MRLILLSTILVLITAPLTTAQEAPQSDSVLSDTTAAPEGATPVAVEGVSVKDNPDDKGGSVLIDWHISSDDRAGGKVTGYKILRSRSRDGKYEEVGDAASGKTSYTDNNTEDGVPYFYKVIAINELLRNGQVVWEAKSTSNVAGPVESSAQWFDLARLNIFIGIVILCGAIIYYIWAAKGGKQFYIRKIAGIEEVENAVGRATEMGRAIYYVPGINDMDDVQTLASMTILGKVSSIAAMNDTRIDVPVSRSMVMVTAREVVKESYSKAGRPDSYQEDQVRYLTDDQFGYAAAIDGLFVREKPATIFLIGAFFAESLIMAETGNSIGAIQIAGTAMPAQLPFFVAACDYTLIGEEMFAASAYLSREPKLLGSLKGQDLGKAIFLLALLLGVILESIGVPIHQLFAVHG